MPIVVHGPELPPGRYWKAIEAMSGSVAFAVSVTVPRSVSPGSTTLPPGGVVSIVTSTDFSVSMFPALSVERNWTVWTPSFEWSAGAGTTTVVPVWKLPPSILYCVESTPEPGVDRGERDRHVGRLRAGRRVAGRRRRGVVDADVRHRRRGGRVAGVVGRGRAQVVEAVGDRDRVPGGRSRRPAVLAGRRVLVDDAGDPGAGVARGRAERDRAADVRARARSSSPSAACCRRARSATGAETAELPALSVTTACRS